MRNIVYVSLFLIFWLSLGDNQKPLRSAPPATPLPAGLIRHGDRSRPEVALTFDGCQAAGQRPARYDERIGHILRQTNTPATFFLGGLWLQSHPAQARALAANPRFEVGNHSWSHANFAELTPAEMEREIAQTQAIIHRLMGRQAVLFRFPGGIYTEEALAVVTGQGLKAVQWDVVTGDPDPRIPARVIVQTVAAEVQNGSIIIMHLNGRHTAAALPAVIDRLRQDGYRLVTVSQLLEAE